MIVCPDRVPELPEVEYHAYELRTWLKDQCIERAEADETPMLRGKTTTKSFAKVLSGHAVVNVERRGKYLVFQLDDGHWLLSHLGMTGRWYRLQSTDPVPRASHARLYLSDASILHNVDARMFGILQIVPKDKLDKVPEIRDLGPDPLRDVFDAHVLQKALGASRAAIKVLLLDPKTIAGIGNIHATEALYHAKIHPSRAASSLSPDELAALAQEITATIKRGLADHERHGGVVYLSDRTGMANPFVAYGRSGEPCPRCETLFTHIILAGRTSVLCPHCTSPPSSHKR